jgi:pantetheine-phosphate adenylyltransferase
VKPARRIAVYPGSFDPITLGHRDILTRMAPSFDRVVLLISKNRSKNGLFTPEERATLAREALKDIPGVEVDLHGGLTVDYVKKIGAGVILRGLRAVTDFEYELVMANMNKKLAPDIETMIVFASPEFYYVSSDTVKEVALHGGKVSDLVPTGVEKALIEKFRTRTAE